MDPIALRFAAAMMHSVVGARLCIDLCSGYTTTVSYEPNADISPCDWRSIVTAACVHEVEEVVEYPERIAGLRFDRGLDPVGNTARRTHEGKLEFWFASTLTPDRLREVFADYNSPIHPGTVDAAIVGDTELRVTLGRVQEIAPCARQHLHCIASTLAAQAAVAELIDEGVWSAAS